MALDVPGSSVANTVAVETVCVRWPAGRCSASLHYRTGTCLLFLMLRGRGAVPGTVLGGWPSDTRIKRDFQPDLILRIPLIAPFGAVIPSLPRSSVCSAMRVDRQNGTANPPESRCFAALLPRYDT